MAPGRYSSKIGMLAYAYAHFLASPSASACLSFPTPLLSIAAFLVLRQY